MSPPHIEPSEEVLHAIKLTNPQFRFGLALAATPEGLTSERIAMPSKEEIDELIDRGFIMQTGDHFHATVMGSGLLKAIAAYVVATS